MARRTALQRARQLARASPLLSDIHAVILSEEMRACLLAAAQARQAPVGAISAALVERFGRDSFASIAARQFVGFAVAARLEALNFVPDGTRVRIKGDPIFSSGALFQRAAEPPRSSVEDLLARLVASLTDAEAIVLAALLDQRGSTSERSRAGMPDPRANSDDPDAA